ncbi:hypothetical protein HanIR_Chr09g0448061 [Helianthus annuus]|nr:hypothetical protein HanIR_Chr09g0448061 [Helianthus annuus]
MSMWSHREAGSGDGNDMQMKHYSTVEPEEIKRKLKLGNRVVRKGSNWRTIHFRNLALKRCKNIYFIYRVKLLYCTDNLNTLNVKTVKEGFLFSSVFGMEEA